MVTSTTLYLMISVGPTQFLLGVVFLMNLNLNPRFRPRRAQNRIQDALLYMPTYFHQDPMDSRWFRD